MAPPRTDTTSLLVGLFFILLQVLRCRAAMGCVRTPSCDTDEEQGYASVLCGQRRLSCIPQMQHHARFLDMHGNQLTTILADAFRQFYNLERLDLSMNEISSITPGAFAGMHNLTNLILKSNRITSLSASTFSGATKLDTLDLSRNNISMITTGAFNELQKLRTLYLSENQLNWLRPGMFQGLPRLNLLSIHSNELKTIDQAAFTGMAELRALQLNNNQISTMSNIFTNMPALNTLWLGENPIECDCRVEYLRRLLIPQQANAGIIAVRHPVICHGPSMLQGLDLRYVKDPLQCTKPNFKRGKVEYLIAQGADITMKCDASGIPSPALSWRSPLGEPIPSITANTANLNYNSQGQTPRIMVRSDGSLAIRHAQYGDGGNYTCVAKNPGGQAMAEIRVKVVNELPRPTIGMPSMSTVENWPRREQDYIGNQDLDGYPNQELPTGACIPERSQACDSATGVVVTAIVTFLTTIATCVVIFYLWYRKQTAKMYFGSSHLPHSQRMHKDQGSVKPTLRRFINAISNPTHLYAKPKPTKKSRNPPGYAFHKGSSKMDDARRHIIAPLTEKPSILSQGIPDTDAPPPPLMAALRSHPKSSDQKRLSVPRELLRSSTVISRSSHLYENATAINDDPNYTALDPMTRCIVNDTYVS